MGQLGQRFATQQCGGQRIEHVAQSVAGTKNNPPAEAHTLDHARPRQGRQYAGANQRRLAAAAHAQHQQERPAGFGLALQMIDHLADGLGAAEEDGLVLEIKMLQAAKGRALQPGWRQGEAVLRGGARGRQAAIDQFAEVVFEMLLEIVLALEGMEGGDQGAFLVGEPLVEKCLQGFDLTESLCAPAFIAQVGEGPGRFTIDQKIGDALLFSPFDRLDELKFRAGEIGIAGDVPRQSRAQPRPEDADHDVGLAGRDQALLEGPVGGERLVFPEDGLQAADVAVDVLQPSEDPLREEPFLGHVAGRRDEDLECGAT